MGRLRKSHRFLLRRVGFALFLAVLGGGDAEEFVEMTVIGGSSDIAATFGNGIYWAVGMLFYYLWCIVAPFNQGEYKLTRCFLGARWVNVEKISNFAYP